MITAGHRSVFSGSNERAQHHTRATMTEGTDTDPPTRYQTLRDGREFVVLFEHEDRKRAAEARRSETLSARIARNRGWLPIAPTPSERRYVSGLAGVEPGVSVEPRRRLAPVDVDGAGRRESTRSSCGRKHASGRRTPCSAGKASTTREGRCVGASPGGPSQDSGSGDIHRDTGRNRCTPQDTHAQSSTWRTENSRRGRTPCGPGHLSHWRRRNGSQPKGNATGHAPWRNDCRGRQSRPRQRCGRHGGERSSRSNAKEATPTRRWNQRQRRGDAETDRADRG